MSRIRAAYWDPDGSRYGIPTFWWRGAPPGYATRRQLTAAGLRPGGQPVAAQVLWRGVGGTRTAYLYRLDLARPKRTATGAAARRRARPGRASDLPDLPHRAALLHPALAG